ncbi:type II secretion system protein N [Pelagibius sp. Alg239-R121]|uniref:type II secretion system protein N n=1 Tax=Pelagibius sp. Alg239-R121 TaxID=2993448 RepID=UPI0024A6C21C|nr:type II secretion system protein N [Pelagibius sp. Alg239-R121]
MRILGKFNLVLCLICGVLGYFLYQESLRAPDRVPVLEPGTAAQGAGQSQSAMPDRMPARDQFSQLIARPPFSATRRPPQPRRTVVVTKPQPIARPRIVLVGTFVNSVSSVAVILKAGTEKQIRLSRGETIDGWTLENILPDRIQLKSKDETFEVELRDPGSSNR